MKENAFSVMFAFRLGCTGNIFERYLNIGNKVVLRAAEKGR
jgi:hypothetical protein